MASVSPAPADAALERGLLVSALRQAAPLALNFFRPGERCTAEIRTKSDGSSVTQADLAVNEALKRFLLSARPDYGWLSEEDVEDEIVDERLSRRRAFLLDPIDGTRSFIEGSDAFCLSVAVVEDGVPLAAAVFAPARGRMYDAALGAGARLNETSLLSSPKARNAPPRVMALKRDLKDDHWEGRPPEAERSYLQPIAHRLCAVAAGDADGLIALKSVNEWDIAAADLIAREAGATVTDLDGAALTFNKRDPLTAGLLAAPAPLHADWLARGPRVLKR